MEVWRGSNGAKILQEVKGKGKGACWFSKNKSVIEVCLVVSTILTLSAGCSRAGCDTELKEAIKVLI